MAEIRKPQLRGFGLANYRSFDGEGFLIEDLRKINVLIGKNNAGKSNILRGLRVLSKINKPNMPQGEKSGYEEGLGLVATLDSYGGNGKPPSVTVDLASESLVVTNEVQLRRFRACMGDRIRVRWNTANGASETELGLGKLDDSLLVQLHDLLTTNRYMGYPTRQQLVQDIIGVLVPRAVEALQTFKQLVFVGNFRELRKADPGTVDQVAFNGHNIIERLRIMQHPKIGQERERETFDRIQEFVRSLLNENGLRIEIPTEEESIYVSMHSKRLPLASYGTGVHQLVILCAALAMYERHTVCIEEPEIHIHPELQRKFLRFIAYKTQNQYFITTHSNVFLDSLPDVSVYHVTHDGEKTSVRNVDTTPKARDILTDMGYKASDLLQANGVIWVEGPSDRVYLNRWLSLVASDLVEGIHYSVAFFGGKVLAHFSGQDDPVGDLVEVLRINRNAFFMIDRDGDSAGAQINANKARILEEIGPDSCWITQGREVENYLRPTLVSKYLSKRCNTPIEMNFEPNDHLGARIKAGLADVQGASVDYDKGKVACARELCSLMTVDDLDVLDLKERLETLVGKISAWNGLTVAKPDSPHA